MKATEWLPYHQDSMGVDGACVLSIISRKIIDLQSMYVNCEHLLSSLCNLYVILNNHVQVSEGWNAHFSINVTRGSVRLGARSWVRIGLGDKVRVSVSVSLSIICAYSVMFFILPPWQSTAVVKIRRYDIIRIHTTDTHSMMCKINKQKLWK